MEIAILGLAVLVLFGPKQLPQLMRKAGKIMHEVRKASYEFQSSLEREVEDDHYKRQHRREKKRKEKAEKLGISPDELDPTKNPEPAADVAAAPATNGTHAPANGSHPESAAPPEPQPADAPAAAEPVNGESGKTSTSS